MLENLFRSKARFFIILALLAAVAVLAFFLYQNSRPEKKVIEEKIEVPQTNPFEEVKTNPFKDIKTNPFE